MTVKQAERITGMQVVDTGHRYYFAELGVGYFVSRVRGNPSESLRRLVEMNYRIVSARVLVRARYRCEQCGCFRPLQVHHRQKRSHGRLDVESNLTALCQQCHGDAHGERIKR